MHWEMVWRLSQGMIGELSQRVSWGNALENASGNVSRNASGYSTFCFNFLMYKFCHKGYITNYFSRMMWSLKSSQPKALAPFLSIDLGIATFRCDSIQLKHLSRSSFLQIYCSLALSGKKEHKNTFWHLRDFDCFIDPPRNITCGAVKVDLGRS